MNERDLIGYGANPPSVNWPNGAKIAISFVVNYEEGGEHTLLNGDQKSEVFLNETPGGAARIAKRDMNMETQYEYGSRVGVWRILRLFQKYQYKFTCFAVGRAVEQNPYAITAMCAAGHEIASHNHKWIDFDALDEESEMKCIRQSIDSIKKVMGSAPGGWYTGRISENSRKLVWEEYKRQGLTLSYDCDAYNDDLPYWITVEGEGHLVIPYTLDCNDMKFAVSPGFGGPDAFYDYLKNTFDVLYDEGLDGSPKMMSVGLHCRLVGKPGRLASLRKFMEYIKAKDQVWICTREEIAAHWKKAHPFYNK